jgi:peptidyl-prolyl cis-trans isomerase A (cyclophilin A)
MALTDWKAAILCAALLAGPASAQVSQPAQESATQAPAATPSAVTVVLHTSRGDIQLALDQARAPITVANFLHYTDSKRFDNISFYRVVRVGDDGKYGLVQGGLQGNPRLAFKPIAHESPSATGLSHLDGAISMARTAPGTATADFFLVIGDLVSLDGKPPEDPGYAVFGRVTAGMDIVRQMLNLPRDPDAGAEAGMKDQMLAQPVKIYSVRRAE